ncbi:NAD(P)-dependent dehydrogenase (short-subunit alcohol dehydrogenase family) [Tamaricihabitans halophyticus]|uniref:NAD(P)-dependent dehydrogenase (Short-subunit alcohol dehydrogenase family) n=1 Tax=Tamaricihabitans halophyticus TaxID=1262583 RepID=A0A4V2SSA8_9PSEU|nr:SDR family oxidoreductase [Tamaricihabitans halophyticus]TCP45726.1 NAD(P)-dependent dehydrogenase (short-subunit alcohol dehydrogenase family) [Tamaricihabitans halophyticus]
MVGSCVDRSVIITGAGQGLGRSHALEFARHGAKLVLNDAGTAVHGVAEEIRAAGGTVVVSTGDIADWHYAAELVHTAVDAFGQLDTLVNNAGINRDRMLATMSEQDWDEVLRVDLKGHFAPLRHAAAYWRERAKSGGSIAARIVNTSSGAGLLGSVGQGNYAAAKAGIAVLTQIAAVELGRYGVQVNAIAPSARTPMTESVFAEMMAKPADGFDAMDPANVAPLVVWLGSARSVAVTGRVFEVSGGDVALADGWRYGEPVAKRDRWQVDELDAVVAELLERAGPPAAVYGA